MEKIKGLIDAPFTPFYENGEVNYEPIEAYAKLLVKNGLKGVFINGSSGEGYMLTDEEGKESEFELIGKGEVDGQQYIALIPLEDNEEGFYVILKLTKDENGEDVCVSVDDDDEFEEGFYIDFF